jgi:hypothetical protein
MHRATLFPQPCYKAEQLMSEEQSMETSHESNFVLGFCYKQLPGVRHGRQFFDSL